MRTLPFIVFLNLFTYKRGLQSVNSERQYFCCHSPCSCQCSVVCEGADNIRLSVISSESTHDFFSENRRHVVLSKPDASHADVDDILRKKWEKLSDKEKLRYFQRALNAIKDENRHSNRRHEEGMSILCAINANAE